MSLKIIPLATAAAPKSTGGASSSTAKGQLTKAGASDLGEASDVLGAEVDLDHAKDPIDGPVSQRFGATLRQALGQLPLEEGGEPELATSGGEPELAISDEQLQLSLGQGQNTVALLEQSPALGASLDRVGVGPLTSLAGDHHQPAGATQGRRPSTAGGGHFIEAARSPELLEGLAIQLARRQLSKAGLDSAQAGKIPMAVSGALSEGASLPSYGINPVGAEALSAQRPSIPTEQSHSMELSSSVADKPADAKLEKASAANGSEGAAGKTADSAAQAVARGAAGGGLTGDPGRSGSGFFGAGTGGGEGAFGGVLESALVSGGSSTAATADAARPDITRAALMRQVADRMNVMVSGSESRAVLELSPPELGRLRMFIKLQGAAVSVQLVAETAAAQQALEADSAALRQALEDVGLALTGLEVSLGDSSADESDASHDKEVEASAANQTEEPEDSGQESLARARRMRHEGEVDVVA